MRKQTNIKRGRWVYKWRTAITIVAMLVAFSCSQEDSGPQMGCITGISESTGERIYIGCGTMDQFMLGSIGVKDGVLIEYKQHEWKAVSDCEKCK